MAINIKRAIVHELIKQKDEEPSPLHISQNLLSINDKVEKVIMGLIKIYGRKNNSARYGIFNNESTSGVPLAFQNFLIEDEDENFKAFTQVIMTSLFEEASRASASTGGHIIFIDYINEGTQFFLSAMIKQKEGFAFSNSLDVEDLEYIDLSKLHQAVRINFSKYRLYQTEDETTQQELTYLSFVGGSQQTANYFIRSMGCKAGSPSAKATEAVIKESVAFFNNNDELKPFASALKKEIKEYLNIKLDRKENATLSDLEKIARKYFPTEDEEQADNFADNYIAHLNSDENSVPPEFPVSKSKLKSMTYLVYKGDDGLHIEFDYSDLGVDPNARVYFDGRQIIIKELPEGLIEKINQQLEERNQQEN